MRTPRVAALAALFAIGGVAGASVTGLLTSEGSEPVALVAGQVVAEPSDGGGLAVTLDLYNPTGRTVIVDLLAIGGSEVMTDGSAGHALAAHGWTAMTVEAMPECNDSVGASVDLAGDGVDERVPLSEAAVIQLSSVLRPYCEGPIELDPVVVAATADGEGYRVDLQLPGHGRKALGGVPLEDVAIGQFFMVSTVHVEELPAMLMWDEPLDLVTHWTFDCDDNVFGPDASLVLDSVSGPQVTVALEWTLLAIALGNCVSER